MEEEFRDEVIEKSHNLIDMIVGGKLGDKVIPVKTIEDHSDHTVRNNAAIFDELIKIGSVVEICKGVYAYSGIFYKIFKYFDRKINVFGLKMFDDAKEFVFPVLYPIKNFEKGRYFETFPHHIMFQTLMKNDIDILNRFAEKGTSDPTIFEEMKMPVNVLRNATCVPVYEMLSGQEILQNKPRSFIVSGICFRNESDNVFELARLNEFTMKEYVFVGTPKLCTSQIQKAKKLWNFWSECFQLNCKIDTANDSFFASNYKKLKLFQILGDSKQEFKCYLPASDSYIACGSANFHRTHFTKPYNIKTNEGTFCNSACFAFGIERLTYALLSQKGINPEMWDDATRKEISTYVELR